MNILEACQDANLFGPWFRDPETWEPWRAFLAALFGLPMDESEAAYFRKHTGRQEPPAKLAEEAWLIVGRRGGKSFIMALVGVFLACFKDYRQYLQPGERATVAIIAADRKQARVILRYVKGFLNLIPMLKHMIERETAEGYDLSNSVTIEVTTASFRSARGYTFAAVLGDEIAFWRTGDEVANPDYEILAAIRPGLVTIPGAMLICASSPHARRGELWDAYRRWWGKDDAPLVWKGTTRDMHPSVKESIITAALERDPSRGAAEYLAEFRADIEAFVTREIVEACIMPGVHERCRIDGVRYVAFVDPSGGSKDSMTMAIAHREKGKTILDAIRERKPPFSPQSVAEEFAKTLASYGIREVHGDRYAGEWPREQFRNHGIQYRVSDAVRSDLYRDFLPVLNSGTVELLDSDKLLNQLVSLERAPRVGKELIDHPPNGHDDVANAVAGAVWLVSRAVRAPTAFSMPMRFTDNGSARMNCQ